MSASSDYANAVTQLLLAQGQARADAQRQNAQIWGGTLANLGQLGAQTFQQFQAARAAKHDEELVRGLFSNGTPTPQQIMSTLGPERGLKVINGLAALKTDPAGDYEKTQKILQATVQGMDALPEGVRAEVYPTVRQSLVQRGIIPDDETLAPKQYDPNWWTRTVNYGKQAPAPPKKEPFTLNPGDVRFDENGNQIATNPKPTEPPRPVAVAPGGTLVNPQTGETVFASPPLPSRPISVAPGGTLVDPQSGKKIFQAPPSASAAGAAGGLSPDAIEDTATRYRILGTSAIPTRIEGSERVKILNAAAKQTRAVGNTAASEAQKQAAFKADAAALTQMQKMKASAEAFETKALAQADLISDLSKKVNRTQYPFINNALLAGKKSIAGDTNTQLLFNALDSFTTEYAKIMAGSTGSVAASSDAATRKAEGLISAALNKGTLQATLDQMKWEMAQTNKGYDATIAHITERMGGVPTAPSTTTSGGVSIKSITPVK